jgi:hypothetical protein
MTDFNVYQYKYGNGNSAGLLPMPTSRTASTKLLKSLLNWMVHYARTDTMFNAIHCLEYIRHTRMRLRLLTLHPSLGN